MKGILRHRIWGPILLAVLVSALVGASVAVATVVTDIGTRHGNITPEEPICLNDSSDFAVSTSSGSSVFVELSIHNASMSPIGLVLGHPYTPTPKETIYLVNDVATVDPGDTILHLEYKVKDEAALGDYVIMIEVWRGDNPVTHRDGVITVVPPSITLISTAPFSITGAYAGDIVSQDFTVHSDYVVPIPLIISAVVSPSHILGKAVDITLLTTSAVANPNGDTVIPVQFQISTMAFSGIAYRVDVTVST
jgi:hypothetical protein